MNQTSVVHLTSVHTPFDIRIFRKECQSLSQAGYRVALIAPHNHEEISQGIRIIPLEKPKRRLQRMSRTTVQVYRKAKQLDADVYHFHDPELIPTGLLLQAQGKKVIYDIHEDTPRALFSHSRDYLPAYSKRLTSWLFERFENFACRYFSGIIAATPAIARRFHRFNSDIRVINNFPILGELKSLAEVSWQERLPVVGYAGMLTAERGVRQMIEAMGYLPQHLQVKLKLAGDTDILQRYNAYDDLTRLPSWQNVEILGYLGRSELAHLFSQLCAGLLLFHPDPNHVEAQPNKLFEYMSAGLPVIASNFPLWREIIETVDCGLLVDPLDAKAIAQAIEYIVTHPNEAQAMGKRGRQAVEGQYNWTVEERKLFEFYSNVINRN